MILAAAEGDVEVEVGVEAQAMNTSLLVLVFVNVHENKTSLAKWVRRHIFVKDEHNSARDVNSVASIVNSSGPKRECSGCTWKTVFSCVSMMVSGHDRKTVCFLYVGSCSV